MFSSPVDDSIIKSRDVTCNASKTAGGQDSFSKVLNGLVIDAYEDRRGLSVNTPRSASMIATVSFSR